MIYTLNAPVLTSFGHYSFKKIGPDQARELLSDGFISAVGHKGTAEVMSEIIGIEIPFNRIPVQMRPGDQAVVLWLLERPQEGHVYSVEELDRVPCELGLLKRIS
ncbi:MAG TPA: YddF family protein [Dissulfurispiraceae bacterium]|nr:YddF family protein [Dissulfurispiraceae bacterium]